MPSKTDRNAQSSEGLFAGDDWPKTDWVSARLPIKMKVINFKKGFG
jgi:hypothetical protein